MCFRLTRPLNNWSCPKQCIFILHLTEASRYSFSRTWFWDITKVQRKIILYQSQWGRQVINKKWRFILPLTFILPDCFKTDCFIEISWKRVFYLIPVCYTHTHTPLYSSCVCIYRKKWIFKVQVLETVECVSTLSGVLPF